MLLAEWTLYVQALSDVNLIYTQKTFLDEVKPLQNKTRVEKMKNIIKSYYDILPREAVFFLIYKE